MSDEETVGIFLRIRRKTRHAVGMVCRLRDETICDFVTRAVEAELARLLTVDPALAEAIRAVAKVKKAPLAPKGAKA